MEQIKAPALATDAIVGCLLGTAVGDAIGLPAEGLTRDRQRLFFGELDSYRLLPNRGMISDDTEHAAMVAQALIASAGDTETFLEVLAQELRGWTLLLPAGAGAATLRAGFKLLFGVSPERSGVYSAGNGSAMRAPILGVCYGNDLDRLRALVHASTYITHTDLKAEIGALTVALAAHQFAHGKPDAHRLSDDLCELLSHADTNTLRKLLDQMAESAGKGEETAHFAESIGLRERVTGYIYHTVPVALHAAYHHPDNLRNAIRSAVACGGDTDTVAAITGGIVGARVGPRGIPQDWRDNLRDGPRSLEWLTRLGTRLATVLATGHAQERLPLPFVPLLARNLIFFLVVLVHGFRRLLPPY